MTKLPVPIGAQFERQTVLAAGHASPYWLVKCVCGTEHEVRHADLRRGRIKSCGCRNVEAIAERNAQRSMAPSAVHHVEYYIWSGMHARCADQENERYGGRGIRVCERWFSFEAFLADMGPRPEGVYPSGRAHYSIERKNNDGDYEPSNCVWALASEQSRNTERTIIIDGLALIDYCKLHGLKYRRVRDRIRKLGWSASEASDPAKYTRWSHKEKSA